MRSCRNVSQNMDKILLLKSVYDKGYDETVEKRGNNTRKVFQTSFFVGIRDRIHCLDLHERTCVCIDYYPSCLGTFRNNVRRGEERLWPQHREEVPRPAGLRVTHTLENIIKLVTLKHSEPPDYSFGFAAHLLKKHTPRF